MNMSKVVKLDCGRYAKPCPQCGEEQTYLRKNYAEESLRLGKLCKNCSNKITDNCKREFYNCIRLSWFNKFKVGAETRGLVWDLSIEAVYELYIAQEKVCALSGIPIGWAEVGVIHTASLDRIDSSLGYTLDNVQLVHKDINMMKQSYSNERFVELCKAVANKVKW